MIYLLVKKLVKFSLHIFFKRIVISGREHIPSKGPLIIVSNHPNTLMDPFTIGVHTKQRIGFLGNAGLFENKLVARIFKYFHVIPVYRKQDVPEGAKRDNSSAFAACHAYLKGEGTILIFPEGTSHYELKLREIKTGTARIALSYEALHQFKGDLKILPIALDYSDSIQFRSMLSVHISPPMTLEAYQEQYELENALGVEALTDDIEKELARHIPQTATKDQEALLLKTHSFYTTFHEPEADLHLDPARSLKVRKKLSKKLGQLHESDPESYDKLNSHVHSFFWGLKKARITPGFFTERFQQKSALLVCLGYTLTFLLLLPVYLFGLLTNYLPYTLPSRLFRALHIEIEYKAALQMCTGMFTFPIFYGLELALFRSFVSDELWHSLIFLIALPVSGYMAMYFYTEAKRFARVLRYYFRLKPEKKQDLMELRDKISKILI